MIERPIDLPDFSNPPVVETVLSVQFDRLTVARTAHFGLYWNEVHDRFPQTEEHGELQPVVERQSESSPSAVGIQFQALEAPPPPRFWFANEDGTELIQLQRDRFIKNWRKVGEGDQYPRYEYVRQGFERDFASFRKFASRYGLGALRVNQCEVTYVNHIVAGVGWRTHAEIAKVFSVWRQPNAPFPGLAQDVSFHARFPILTADGEFVGRLHATVQSVVRLTDGIPMFVLDLTARGQIGSGTDFFDLGREWIVKSFKELTTPEMHQIWGIRN